MESPEKFYQKIIDTMIEPNEFIGYAWCNGSLVVSGISKKPNKIVAMIAERDRHALIDACERVRGLDPPLDFDDEERTCDVIMNRKEAQ